MRQVLTLAKAFLGYQAISHAIWATLIFFAGGLWWKLLRGKQGWPVILSVLLLFVGLGFASILEMAEERIHLIEYALIGIMVSRDLHHKGSCTAFIVAIFAGSIVGISDELLQWALPYRVGDIRDVMFDTFGALWGASIWKVLGAEGKKPNVVHLRRQAVCQREQCQIISKSTQH